MKVYINYSIKILSINKIGKVIQTNETKPRQDIQIGTYLLNIYTIYIIKGCLDKN